jgi:hypothetical protein
MVCTATHPTPKSRHRIATLQKKQAMLEAELAAKKAAVVLELREQKLAKEVTLQVRQSRSPCSLRKSALTCAPVGAWCPLVMGLGQRMFVAITSAMDAFSAACPPIHGAPHPKEHANELDLAEWEARERARAAAELAEMEERARAVEAAKVHWVLDPLSTRVAAPEPANCCCLNLQET